MAFPCISDAVYSQWRQYTKMGYTPTGIYQKWGHFSRPSKFEPM